MNKSELVETLAGYAGTLTGIRMRLRGQTADRLCIGMDLATLDCDFTHFVLSLNKEKIEEDE